MHSNTFGNWFCGPDGIFYGMYFGGFFPFIFWAVGLFLLFTLIRSLTSSRQKNNNQNVNKPSALSILEQRYAAGEIDQDDFFQKKSDLTH
jgi:putative membrane protein